MEKSSKNEKSLWIKSRKKPGPEKNGKIGFSEDRKRDLAESDKGSWFDQETLVDVEGSVKGDHEELEQRPSNLSTVIGSSTQRSIAVQKSCRETLQASCENINNKKITIVYYFYTSVTPTLRSILFDKKTRIKIRKFWVVVADKLLFLLE